MKSLRHASNNRKEKKQNKNPQYEYPQTPLTADLSSNVEMMKAIYADCDDIKFQDFRISNGCNATLIFVVGFVDKQIIDQFVLSPLCIPTSEEITADRVYEEIPISSKKRVHTAAEVIDSLFQGNAILLMEGEEDAFAIELSKFENRAINEPEAETVVRGPRTGFIESIQVNISILRKTLKTPQLKTKPLEVGRYTKTNVMIAYIEGIAEPTLVEEVTARLNKIDFQGILESSYIEEFIEDNTHSPFPQLISTERPDVVSANLLDGRVAILVDGTPFVLIAPATFFSLIQSPEDYYQRFWSGTATRIIRFTFLVIALLGPSFYVAIISYHQEMLPTALLLTMANSREQVPFPALVEALLMEVTFEALREAGIRLPRQIGSAVSIVGALVIGQAAISSGLVSPPMVMVVAITGVSSFMIPRYSLGVSLRLLRFPLMFFAGFLGLLGLILGFLLILTHLLRLRSFGTPYLFPLAPTNIKVLEDALIRTPYPTQK